MNEQPSAAYLSAKQKNENEKKKKRRKIVKIFYNINFKVQMKDGKLNSLNAEFNYSARTEHGEYIIYIYVYIHIEYRTL